MRIKALTILTERVASPKEIAKAIGEPKPGNVSHHVRVLEKYGLVEEVDTKQRRGATEHFFRAVQRPTVWNLEALTREEREEFSAFIIACMNGDFVAALESGSLDERTDRHLSRTPLQLDEQGYLDLVADQDRALERSLEIQAESDERRSQSGEEAMAISSHIAVFPMPKPNGR
ncbi:MAG TPA: winged helix-turn-helix domain-containing protein [Solirubrobacterales bacterium]